RCSASRLPRPPPVSMPKPPRNPITGEQDLPPFSEKRIEVITRSASGKTQLADFEPEPTARKNTPTPAPTPSEPDDLLLS
ncbi:MAG: hypothetical protein RLZZ253_3050, partial [Verrucomicrobiota bacterium]